MEIPTHQEMQEIWARQRQLGEAVRMMADDGVTPEAGHFYTVTADFSNGDDSWTNDFWEVLTVNGPKVFVRIHQTGARKVERFFDTAARAWYLADDAWAVRTTDQGE